MLAEFLDGEGTVVPVKEHEAGIGRRDKGKQSVSTLKNQGWRLSLGCKYQDKNEPEVFLQDSETTQGQDHLRACRLWDRDRFSAQPRTFRWIQSRVSSSSWGCGALWRCLSSGCSSLHTIVTTSSCILKTGRCGEKPFVHSTPLLPQLWADAVRPPGFVTWIFQEMQEMKLQLCREPCANKTRSPCEWQWYYCKNWQNLFIC